MSCFYFMGTISSFRPLSVSVVLSFHLLWYTSFILVLFCFYFFCPLLLVAFQNFQWSLVDWSYSGKTKILMGSSGWGRRVNQRLCSRVAGLLSGPFVCQWGEEPNVLVSWSFSWLNGHPREEFPHLLTVMVGGNNRRHLWVTAGGKSGWNLFFHYGDSLHHPISVCCAIASLHYVPFL